MTKRGMHPYRAGDYPAVGSVPVSVVILTCDEEPNISHCLTSTEWADQVIVLDSGSADRTTAIARSLGADVVEQSWLGYSGQREYALRMPKLKHNWVYFVDADEWISRELAAEISDSICQTTYAGFSQRRRLMFQGRWIRHCGWYKGSWLVRLTDRRYTRYDGNVVGERACVDGQIGRLRNDLVDEDRKGLASWLRKHIGYAELEAERRRSTSFSQRLTSLWSRQDTRPLSRAVLKDLVYPAVPGRPVALFLYMYILRLGLLDGMAGLRFCFFHAWYETSVSALRRTSENHLITSVNETRATNQ